MTQQVGFVTALVAGVVTFLSPCVLPLIPGYLSFMTGVSIAELSAGDGRKVRTIVPALLFVAGFSFVFVALGASASAIGQFLAPFKDVAEKVAGVAVVLFGVFMLGVIRLPWLYGEARVDLERARSFGRASSFVMGMAFAAGWTPCVGPILGSILALASSTGSVSQGALLLLVFSLGLGVPFVAVALLFSHVAPLMRWLNAHSLVINRVAGSLLIVIGLAILTGRLALLGSWLSRFVPTIGV